MKQRGAQLSLTKGVKGPSGLLGLCCHPLERSWMEPQRATPERASYTCFGGITASNKARLSFRG